MANEYLDAKHTRTSVSWVSNGTTYLTYMYQAERSTRGPFSFQKWYECRVCVHKEYPESQVMFIQGAPYCTYYGHAAERLAEINRRKKPVIRTRRRRYPG